VLDLAGARLHLLCRPRHSSAEVPGLLRRWSGGRGLGELAVLGAPHLAYYPFWRYELAGRPRLVPAWPTLDPRWGEIAPPDAEQVVFDPAELGGATLVEAAVEEAAARTRLPETERGKPGTLVHLPFFDASIRVGTLSVSVLIEAGSGQVYAAALPLVRRTSRSGASALVLGAGLLVMIAAAALLPAWWVALPAVAVTALFLYGGVVGGESQ